MDMDILWKLTIWSCFSLVHKIENLRAYSIIFGMNIQKSTWKEYIWNFILCTQKKNYFRTFFFAQEIFQPINYSTFSIYKKSKRMSLSLVCFIYSLIFHRQLPKERESEREPKSSHI